VFPDKEQPEAGIWPKDKSLSNAHYHVKVPSKDNNKFNSQQPKSNKAIQNKNSSKFAQNNKSYRLVSLKN
jgi:hypothetical protein